MLSEVAEVLLELINWQKSAGVDWMRTALRKLPKDGPAMATEQQCLQFHQFAIRLVK